MPDLLIRGVLEDWIECFRQGAGARSMQQKDYFAKVMTFLETCQAEYKEYPGSTASQALRQLGLQPVTR